MHVSVSLNRLCRIGEYVVAGVLVLSLGSTSAAAQTVSRIVAAQETLTIRSCAESKCHVVAEVPRGRSVEVLRTENGWHWVLVTLEGSRATTGWVDATTAAAAPRPAATPPIPERQTLPPSSPAASSAADTTDCLACLATRTTTTDEWTEALAITSGMKVAPSAAVAAGPVGASPAVTRADTVRRDGRTTLERMRDDLEERFGSELRRLAEQASKLDPDLQTYLAVCYDKYLPIAVLPPGPPPASPPPPGRPRATVFDLWRGRPVYGWNESWSTGVLISADSTAFCQGLWKDLEIRAAEVKGGVDRVEADARNLDIYPGVVRDALQGYGLSERK